MSANDIPSIEDIAAGRASEEEVEAYNERTKERLSDRADRKLSDAERERKEALDALRDPERDDTAEVTRGEETLTVKTYTDEVFENHLERLENNQGDPDLQRQLLPKAVAWIVEAPEAYTDAELWREYAREYGRDELALELMHLLEPKLERTEESDVIRRFRNR